MKANARVDARDSVLYLRVSSTAQVRTDYDPEGQSIPSQRSACRARAKELDAPIVAEFVDPGRSARTIEQRPEFQDMIGYVKTHRNVRYVIVYALSRFARNRYDDALMMMRLESLGVSLTSVMERHIDQTPAGKAMHGMIAVFNQYQSDVNGEDIAYKMRQKVMARGGTLGRAPIGYQNIRDTSEGREIRTIAIDDDPERVALVRECFLRYATEEYTIDSLLTVMVARGLTYRATPTKPARPITRSGLRDLLRNRFYIGEVKYKGQWYPGRHEPLISRELFEEVQQVMDNHSGAGVRTRRFHHYLKGIFWCQRCGHRLILARPTNRHGVTYTYYYCVGTKVAGCDQPYLPVEDLEQELSCYYRRVTLSEDFRSQVAARVQTIMANEQASRVELERRLTKQLYDIDAREDRYLDLVGHPDWPQEKLQAKLAGLREQRTLLSQQRHELANTLEIGQAVLDEALGLLAQPQALFDQADDDTRRLLTRTIFDRLSIDTRQIVDHEMREAFDALVSVQRRYQRSAAHAGTSAPRLAPCA